MITTEHMGLVLWDLEKDDFEHSKLSDNFTKIDQHNHSGSVLHGEFEDSDHPAAPVETPTPQTEILNYSEGNAGVAKWEATGSGESIHTPETVAPTATGIKPESIWRYLLARRSVGHNQIAQEGVRTENIKDKAVTTPKIEKGAVSTEKIEDEAVTGKKLAKGLLPLGIIVSWYKSPAEPTPGSFWRVCDGREFGKNDMGIAEGSAVPDLRKKFIRGTDEAHIGEQGGTNSITLSHTHTINNHAHTVNSHSHSISADGGHHHTVAGGYNFRTRQGAWGHNVELFVEGIGNTGESLYVPNPSFDHHTEWANFDEEFQIDAVGSHSHTGATGVASSATNEVGLTSNSALGSYNPEPPWYGLVQIIRVRNS